MITDQFGFPSALQWKGVSDLVAAVFSQGQSPIPQSAVWAMAIAAVVGLGLELVRILRRRRVPALAARDRPRRRDPARLHDRDVRRGRLLLADAAPLRGAARRRRGHGLWVDTQEPICAGMIAGAALVGITDVLVRVFLL